MSQLKDKLETVALAAEITAAVGVIVSVIYLATQVSGNTNALRSQSHDSLLTQFNSTLVMRVVDPELAEMVHRGDRDPDALSPEEWDRYVNFNIIAANSWEYGYYLNQDGSVPPSLWEGGNAYFVESARTDPGFRRFWAEYNSIYAEPFHSYADQFFAEPIE